MKTEDLIDSKVGSRQVTAIYLGSNLIWPTAVVTYEITGAVLHYSSGNIIDAGAVGSNYSGNYAWVTGTVVVYHDGVVYDTLTNEMLTPDLNSSPDFVVLNDYNIYGYNLGVTESSTVKSATIDVTYRNSPSFTVGSQVEQEQNVDTVTTGTPYIVDGPTVVAPDVVPNSYVIVLNLSRFTTRLNPCPAYGDTATLVCYGYHEEANFSTTYWTEYTPYIHSYTSGATQTIPQETDSGSYPPVQVGESSTEYDNIEDNIELSYGSSGGSGWATYDYANDLLTIDSAGSTVYQLPRGVTISVTNGTASESVTAYQHANIVESTSTQDDFYISIRRTTAFPGVGGTFPIDYHSQSVTSTEYTSGTVDTTTNLITSNVSSSFGTTSVNQVSGVGSFNLNLGANTSGQRYVYVYMIDDNDISHSDSDFRLQEVEAVPQGEIYPNIVGASLQMPVGAVRLHWKQTSDTTPTPTYPYSITFTNLALHFVYDDIGTEMVEYPSGSSTEFVATFQSDDSNFYPASDRRFIPLLEGKTGECWFTADSTSGAIATFPHKTFTTPGGGGPTLGD